MKAWLHWLLIRSSRQRYFSYALALLVLSVLGWQWFFSSELQLRQHHAHRFSELQAQLLSLPQEVLPAPALPLPAVLPPLQLLSVQQQPEQLQMRLRGSFAALQLWLQQLGASSWQLQQSEWYWYPEYLELALRLQHGEQQIATTTLTPSPFLAPQPPPPLAPEPTPTCRQLAPSDLAVRLVLNQRALLTSQTFPQQQLWLTVGHQLPNNNLAIATIEGAKVKLASAHHAPPLAENCMPSIVQVPAPKRPVIEWQKDRELP